MKTAGGGWHHWIRTDEPISKKVGLLPGVDLIGLGGFVVAPPTAGYRFIGPVASEVPSWVREVLPKVRGSSLLPSPAGHAQAEDEWPPLADTLSVLEGVRPTAWGYLACCPAHDDAEPSLSIRADGHVVKCFGGCHWSDVRRAVEERLYVPVALPGPIPDGSSIIWPD